MSHHRTYDVAIVGGGVSGTSLLKELAERSNVEDIVLIEKNSGVAQVNSHPLNNAQTSHDGSTETNYSLAHALEIQASAKLLRDYVVKRNVPGLYRKTNRMVLGVGDDEVSKLVRRYYQFKPHYQDLHYVSRKNLEKIEPLLIEGRDPRERVGAIVTAEGFAINYQKLSECFLEDAKRSKIAPHIMLNSSVHNVWREGNIFCIDTDRDVIRARVVVFTAGAYSLWFAHMLGYGQRLALVPIAGTFLVSSRKLVNGKVYRVPPDGQPFSKMHADPDVLNENVTRFGPTTKLLPLMERRHTETFFDFIKMNGKFEVFANFMRAVQKDHLLWYGIKNQLYDLPYVGKALVLPELREIIPSVSYNDIEIARNAGGIRPQILNLETATMEMGDKTLIGDHCIFNTTPSPGASVCRGNAKRDAKRVVEFLGPKYTYVASEEMRAVA